MAVQNTRALEAEKGERGFWATAGYAVRRSPNLSKMKSTSSQSSLYGAPEARRHPLALHLETEEKPSFAYLESMTSSSLSQCIRERDASTAARSSPKEYAYGLLFGAIAEKDLLMSQYPECEFGWVPL